MMCTWRFPMLIAVVCLIIPPLAAQADDRTPPPWRAAGVTLPHSYMAKFDLQQIGQFPAMPSAETIGPSAPYPLDPNIPPMIDDISSPTDPTLRYLVTLPNFIDPLPLKLVRVQFSWFPGDPSGNPNFPGFAETTLLTATDDPGVTPVSTRVFSSPVDVFPDPSDPLRNLAHRYEDWEIVPNPHWEQFTIEFRDADPRWIIIDTISIPEPCSLLLIGGIIGAALVVRRRR